MSDIQVLINLLFEHQWAGAAAVGVFLLVRLMKSGLAPYPVSAIPPKARTLVAVALGFVGAGLQAVATGATWQVALAENLGGVLVAILSHDTFVELLRKGRELGVSKENHAKKKEAIK